MKVSTRIFALGLTALSACAATAGQALGPGETAIQFASNGGIRDWYADNERSIYLMDRSSHWYLATFTNVCSLLPSAQTIHFQVSPNGTFDRFSWITTEDSYCQVASVRPSVAPAAKGGPKG